jgi:hypothetical protein
LVRRYEVTSRQGQMCASRNARPPAIYCFCLKKTGQVCEQIEEFVTLSRHMPCVHPRLHTGNEDRNRLVTALVADVERNAQTAQQKRSVDRVSAIIRAAICEGSQLLGC